MFAEGGSSNVLLILVLGIAVVGMFFMSRRTRKQQGSVSDFRASLAPGSEVMTQAGQLGTVVAVDGDAITIESAGTRSVWVNAAIVAIPAQFSNAADTAFGRSAVEDPSVEDPSEDDVDGLPAYGEHDSTEAQDGDADGSKPGDRS